MLPRDILALLGTNRSSRSRISASDFPNCPKGREQKTPKVTVPAFPCAGPFPLVEQTTHLWVGEIAG